MNYSVKRGEQEFGPYTLAALQQYVAQGNISQQDLARSEGMTDWMPVSAILGNVPMRTAAGSNFGAAAPPSFPLPPNLHWGIVLVLSLVTLFVFAVIWVFVQAAWVRKVRPQSRAIWYLVGYVAAAFVSVYLSESSPPVSALLQLSAMVLFLIAVFSLRSDIEECYAMVNPVGCSLSGVMTFFFNVFYFQYHLREIRETAQNAAVAATAH